MQTAHIDYDASNATMQHEALKMYTKLSHYIATAAITKSRIYPSEFNYKYQYTTTIFFFSYF